MIEIDIYAKNVKSFVFVEKYIQVVNFDKSYRGTLKLTLCIAVQTGFVCMWTKPIRTHIKPVPMVLKPVVLVDEHH